ncbi:MAG TPA: hypothetical protein VKU19_37630 [Bryobacteraceae bacterium]|nr:hypothetical protein [Bryobacteraceae bacterium]
MARAKTVEDSAILEMALVGYQIQLDKIETKIHEIQSLLKGKRTTSGPVVGEKPKTGSRNLSDAARDRIAAAQRKRWAEHRRMKAQAAKA